MNALEYLFCRVPRALVALAAIGLGACARAAPEPAHRDTPASQAAQHAGVLAGAQAWSTQAFDAAIWESMTRREVAMFSRKFGSHAPLPLPIRPVPAPADVRAPPAEAQ